MGKVHYLFMKTAILLEKQQRDQSQIGFVNFSENYYHYQSKQSLILVRQFTQSIQAGTFEVHFEGHRGFLGIGFRCCLLFKELWVGCSIFKKLLYSLTSTGFLLEAPVVRELSSTSEVGGAEITAVKQSLEATSGRQAPLLKKFKLKAFE